MKRPNVRQRTKSKAQDSQRDSIFHIRTWTARIYLGLANASRTLPYIADRLR